MPAPHINIFFGNDEYLIRLNADKFASMFSDPTTASMNSSHLDALTVSENDLTNAANAVPFLAGNRLVVLENVSKRYLDGDGHKRFISFIEAVPASTRLVLIEPVEIKGKDPEKSYSGHWLAKWANKNPDRAEVRLFALPKQREMPVWIVAEAKRQGGAIEFPAASRLAEMTGENTRQAAQEITKLLTYVNYAHSIGLEDVEAVSIVTASVSVFDLVDAIGNQDGKKAQKLFHRLLDEKDAAEIFGMVIRQFRLLTLAREVIDEHGSLQEVTEALGVHPYVAEKSYNQAKNFSMETLKAIYHRLLDMDEAAKTSRMSMEDSLDIFIVELTARR